MHVGYVLRYFNIFQLLIYYMLCAYLFVSLSIYLFICFFVIYLSNNDTRTRGQIPY